MGGRADLVRCLAARVPALTRRVLELSANGAIPRGIFEHWVSQQIIRDVLDDTIRLRWRSLEFDVPLSSYDNYRDFEPETVQAFERLLKPGMVVADIGANIGYTAALAAQLVGPAGRVYACEPSPRTLRVLRRNMSANGLTNVTIHPYIVGDADGMRRFHLTEAALTDSIAAGSWSPTVSTIEVEERRLDNLLAGPVHFVKIDVEGAEIAVLRGMQRLLAQPQEITLIVEWNPITMKAVGHAPMELPQALAAAGFGAITMLDDEAPGTERPLADAIARFASADWNGRDFINLVARRD